MKKNKNPTQLFEEILDKFLQMSPEELKKEADKIKVKEKDLDAEDMFDFCFFYEEPRSSDFIRVPLQENKKNTGKFEKIMKEDYRNKIDIANSVKINENQKEVFEFHKTGALAA